MNYLELKTQFTGLLNRRDITASQITTFLQQALARCQRELRIPAMEKALVATIGTTYNGLTIPSDFLQLIALVNEDNKEITRTTVTLARAYATASIGTPHWYARHGSKWFLGPTPAAGDEVRIDYFAEFDELSADIDTNLLSRLAPELIIYCALSFACDFFLDDRAAANEGRYLQIKAELHNQAALDELSGGAVVCAAFEYPED